MNSSPRLAALAAGAFAWLLLAGAASTAAAAGTQRQLWITNAYGNDVHVYEVGSWKLVKLLPAGRHPKRTQVIDVPVDGASRDEAEGKWWAG